MLKILGNIVDIFNETIFYGELSVVDGKIESIAHKGANQPISHAGSQQGLPAILHAVHK